MILHNKWYEDIRWTMFILNSELYIRCYMLQILIHSYYRIFIHCDRGAQVNLCCDRSLNFYLYHTIIHNFLFFAGELYNTSTITYTPMDPSSKCACLDDSYIFGIRCNIYQRTFLCKGPLIVHH